MKCRSIFLAGLTVLLLAGSCSTPRRCAAPELDLPQTIVPGGEADSLCLADLKWSELITDSLLTDLIHKSLERNKNMLVAADRVMELGQLHRLARAGWYPGLDARGYTTYEFNQSPDGSQKTRVEPGLKASLSWEIDFFGKIRWTDRQAKAEYLSSLEAQRATQMSLIAEVATAYYELVALDNELAIVRNTLTTREENVHHARLRFDGGLTTEIPYQQSQVEYAKTAAMIPELEKKIRIKENEISLLCGSYPSSVERSRIIDQHRVPQLNLVGIPSELVSRRPDLRAAEQGLQAAAAKVGITWAERFPSFRINLQGGLEGSGIEGFFSSPWAYALGEVAAPLFHFGARKAKYEAAIKAYDQKRHGYEQKVLEAFKEVNDAVVTFNSTREQVVLMGNLKDAAAKYVDLTRYQLQTGYIQYIDILDAQRSYFKAEIDYSNALRDEYLAIIRLYKALGGGWDLEEEEKK